MLRLAKYTPTMDVTLPEDLSTGEYSAFTIKEGDVVKIEWNKEEGAVIVLHNPARNGSKGLVPRTTFGPGSSFRIVSDSYL